MASLDRDLHLTAEFITFLRSGLYGQILFESALSRLGSRLLPDRYLETTHKAFDKIDVWSADLINGLPILATSWNTPETFDAVSAMNFMRELKKDLLWLTPKVEAALRVPNLSLEREAVNLLVAALVRSAAARNSYIDTLYSTFIDLKALDLARGVAQELDGAKEYVRVTNIILETFANASTYDEAVCEKLRKEASLTPCDFRSHAHDATILLNVYEKEFTYELAEIPRAEAEQWITHRIPAVAAGHWRAYGFSPEEFLDWQSVGILGAPLAANWRRAKFQPQEAITWIREGIPPSLAIPWNAAGFTPERTGALLRRGVTDPSKAPEGS